MSERALGFVEEWVSENVHAEGYPPEGNNSLAKSLALQCLGDANAKGISEAEIRESIADLTEFMAGAIQETNDREVHRLSETGDGRI
jgi:hypothetical protein